MRNGKQLLLTPNDYSVLTPDGYSVVSKIALLKESSDFGIN